MPTCAFELDRFTAEDDRLEVSGRWLGVRGRRFVRPSLTAFIDGQSTRALAELEHKPWAAEDGDEWVAAFSWRGKLDDIEEFELAVAPDLSVRLPRPDESIEEALLPVVAPQDTAQPAQAPEDERAPEPPRGEPQELREQADAVRHNALAVRDRALADLDAAIAMRDGLRTELDQALAERDEVRASLDHATAERNRAREELEQAAADRGRLSAELDHASTEADRLRGELSRAAAERDRLVAEHHKLDGELGRVRAELRMARSDLVLARKPPSLELSVPKPEARSLPALELRSPVAPTSVVSAYPRRAQLHRPETWGVRALVIALIIAFLIALIIVLTSGPASVAP